MSLKTKQILKKLYIGILVLLVVLLGIIFTFSIVYFLFPDLINLPMRMDPTYVKNAFVHSLGLVGISFLLIILLLVTIHKSDILRQQEENRFHVYQSMFVNMNTGLIVLDDKRILRYINNAGIQLLGRDPLIDLEGTAFRDIVEPLLIPIEERLSTAMDENMNLSREFRVFLNNGIKCIKCDFYTILDNGSGQLYVLSLEDKTEEDNIKQKLSAQLVETKRYISAKDNFFANMSHEIRTPINAILGMTYFVKNLTTQPKCVEYISKIESSSELLLSVVNDILDFSKMQGNKFNLKSENFNLSDIKKILLDLFSLKAQQKGLEMSINFDCPDIFLIYGDQFRLTQIFMNLVSNAVKFTDAGSITVNLNHEVIENDIILRCSVRDTGIGLSEDDISRLFTDFEQFGEVLVKNHEGTGLGLAISKKLVELMNGVIWADSLPGKGSSFHFVVVFRKPAPTFTQTFPADLPHVKRHSNRVLVVEDNEINREIAEALLLELGLSVDHANNGLEAIDLCRSQPTDYYDLVLMDIHMPRMNGYDAARILKQEIAITCPIVVVTATSENSDMLEANKDIISGAILKPYSPGIFRVLFESDVV